MSLKSPLDQKILKSGFSNNAGPKVPLSPVTPPGQSDCGGPVFPEGPAGAA